MEQAGGTVREAGGDGGQAGGAGSLVPVEFQRTSRYMWQVHLGYDKWQEIDPTWAEPLFQALRDGVRTTRLSHSYQNKYGEEVRSWYTIDCQHTNYYVTQENEATGRRRWLRAIHLMALPAVTLRPPTEHLADPAGPADVPTDL